MAVAAAVAAGFRCKAAGHLPHKGSQRQQPGSFMCTRAQGTCLHGVMLPRLRRVMLAWGDYMGRCCPGYRYNLIQAGSTGEDGASVLPCCYCPLHPPFPHTLHPHDRVGPVASPLSPHPQLATPHTPHPTPCTLHTPHTHLQACPPGRRSRALSGRLFGACGTGSPCWCRGPGSQTRHRQGPPGTHTAGPRHRPGHPGLAVHCGTKRGGGSGGREGKGGKLR